MAAPFLHGVHNKRDTHNIETINADLRHYITGLARRSRCFYRSLETFLAAIEMFADAYNKSGQAKLKHHVPVVRRVPRMKSRT